MKVYYYENNGVIVELRSETPPTTPYIERERALPVPVKTGYVSKLCADFGNDIVWYELLETVEGAIQRKVAEIDDYDNSPAVNEFFVGGMPMWIARDLRVALFNSLAVEEAMGRETTTLWTQTTPPIPMELPISLFRQMLAVLEIYAKDSLNVSQGHKAAVCQLETIADVNSYDYTIGYPEKLTFDL